MKILIFSTAYLPFIGGAELAIKEITDRLSPSEFSFDLITLNLDGKQKLEERIGNIRVIRLSCSKLLFPIRACMRAKKLHRERPYDRVWSLMASYGGFAGLFFKYHFPTVPFILTLQEGDSISHIYRRAFLIWPLFKCIFTRADRVTAISNYLADWARRMGAKGEVVVIPNGVAVERFKIKDLRFKKEEKKKELGFNAEDKIIITTSRLVPKNGVGDLIGAMQYLPEHVKLIICGTGSLESNLKLKTSNLQLTGRVTFLGFVPHSELPQYLNASDVFARASRSEGMGSSFVEAMAAGLPVIATPVGGIVDFLFAPLPGSKEEKSLWANSHELAYNDGRITGLFCRVGNPEDIAERVKLLLSNSELRNQIIANASKLVREKYDWDGIAKRMNMVLTKR